MRRTRISNGKSITTKVMNPRCPAMHVSCLDTPSALLSHADICKLRYQTTSFSALHGLSSAMKPPGIQIYNSSEIGSRDIVIGAKEYFPSDQYVALERSTTNAKPLDVEQFLRKYPNYSSTYDAWRRLDDFMEVRAHRSRSISTHKSNLGQNNYQGTRASR